MKPNELNLKMIIPTSIGVFMVASGVCILLFKKYKGKRSSVENSNKKKVIIDKNQCACCLKPLFIIQGVKCDDCKARVCKKSCSHWYSDDNGWICLICQHQRSSIKEQNKTSGAKLSRTLIKTTAESDKDFNTANYQTYVPGAEHVAINSELDVAAGGYETTDSMENTREIIEKIVEKLVGNVDNTPIDRLYTHPTYNHLFDEYGRLLAKTLTSLSITLQSSDDENKPAGGSPSMAYTALRALVDRVVEEARRLPGLGDTVSLRTQENTSISEQSYEDLLAAAIINKVIEKCQNDDIDGNGNFLHEKRKSSRHNEGEEDSSSIEPPSLDERTDASGFKIHRRTRIQDPLSLTIEEQIEEVTTVYTSDEDPGTMKTNLLNFRNAKRVPFPEFGMDIVDPSQDSSEEESQDEVDGDVHVNHITPVESWEENWLFQKKKISIKSEPVAMLVPNPSAEYRALIGDKDAEDTSDLSEFSAHSDEEVEEELIQAINRVVPESSDSKDDHSPLHADDIGIKSMEALPIINNNSNTIVSLPIKSITVSEEKSFLKIEKKFCARESCAVQQSMNKREDFKEEKTNIEDDQKPGYTDKLLNNNLINRVNSNGDIDSNENETIKDKIVLKTPTPTPVRNSLCENDLSSVSTCDIQELKQKLVSIDANMNEEITNIKEENMLGKLINKEINEEQNCKDVNLEKPAKKKMKEINYEDVASEAVTNRCQEAKKAHAEVRETSKSLNPNKNINDEDTLELSAPPRPGTIAEREHKKWENAPPIQNNPYSQENIQKRLLERQYSSRQADVGNPSVLPTNPSPPLQIVLGSSRPDIKRFGRDYYINESKSPTGERQLQSGASNSSRPSSSLSHRSSSTSSDFEQQESFEPIEADSKSLELMQNNKFLERERKNSKNEINAKLNKQGNFDNITTIISTKNVENVNKINDTNQRKIRRIDLRAYGFENEFNNNKDFKKSHQRIPNKLDLRLFGYDSGLRRAQSNNQLDSKVNNSLMNMKANIGHEKLNLVQHYDEDYNWNKSEENLSDEKKMILEKFDPIKSAKSVPNISKLDGYTYNNNRKLISPTSDEDNDRLKPDNNDIYINQNCDISSINKFDDDENNSVGHNNSYESDSQSSKTESDEFPTRKLSKSQEYLNSSESLDSPEKFIDRRSSMPSVKKLAQVFNNSTSEVSPTPRITTTKSVNNLNKERPKTPEVHIIGTPRQMHSLTARSLSKEFREGLRQISHKPNAPISMIIEQSKIPSGMPETNSIYAEKPADIGIIAPGKLKNDIQFWEQLQKKNVDK